MSDEDILKRAMGHFQTRTALHRMGIPVRKDHPVSDAEYQQAMKDAESMRPIPCSERMPPEREYVLMWETPSLRWSVGNWCSHYQQWSNRDDKEYAIHPHQVSHWMPLPDVPSKS